MKVLLVIFLLANLAYADDPYLAAPQELKLDGLLRKEDMASSLGRIKLQWPRSLEKLFGKNPIRAMADAASAVSRTLKAESFPLPLKTLEIDWNVAFMDSEMPPGQIPAYLITNCHPGWMLPPANIYLVAQRIAEGCKGTRVSPSAADAELAKVLIHEMGHAVEFQILGNFGGEDRMRAEGFATWFAEIASENSNFISSGDVRAQNQKLAAEHRKAQPVLTQFDGSAQAYARAAGFFSVIEKKRGVSGVIDVYERMKKDGTDFLTAVKAVTGMTLRELDE